MITIYHNTRCSKSREGLEIIKNSGKEFEVREYLKDPLSEDEIVELLGKLNMTPIQLVRTNEKIWKENYKDKDLGRNEVINLLSMYPKLIVRPIVEKDNAAIIGRPPTRIEIFL